jgi:hypothetical protein
MASDQSIRASDRDRDTVVDALRDAFVAGRLTLEEFNERAAAAYTSVTWGDLRGLTRDLPTQPVLGADVPGRQQPAVPQLPSAPPLPAPPPRHTRPARRGRPAALVPLALFWFMVVVATHSSFAIALPVVVLVLVILSTAISRRR